MTFLSSPHPICSADEHSTRAFPSLMCSLALILVHRPLRPHPLTILPMLQASYHPSTIRRLDNVRCRHRSQQHLPLRLYRLHLRLQLHPDHRNHLQTTTMIGHHQRRHDRPSCAVRRPHHRLVPQRSRACLDSSIAAPATLHLPPTQRFRATLLHHRRRLRHPRLQRPVRRRRILSASSLGVSLCLTTPRNQAATHLRYHYRQPHTHL